MTQIRQGNFVAGRKDIENAVSLVLNSSLIRSYQGRAYFEEGERDIVHEPYRLAKRPHQIKNKDEEWDAEGVHICYRDVILAAINYNYRRAAKNFVLTLARSPTKGRLRIVDGRNALTIIV